MTTSLLDRITTHVEAGDARAATVDGHWVAAALLALLTLPWVVLGILVNVAWLVLRWSIGGVLQGWSLSQQVVGQLLPEQDTEPGTEQGPGRRVRGG